MEINKGRKRFDFIFKSLFNPLYIFVGGKKNFFFFFFNKSNFKNVKFKKTKTKNNGDFHPT